jgi:hypothetical protein
VQQVAADSFGTAIGQGIVDEMQSGGVDWSRAPDESAAESARLDRSGNRYTAWPDQTDAESARLARSGNPYAYWPDQTGAESARLSRYEDRARAWENFNQVSVKVWAAEDAQAAARAEAALVQQNARADAYRRELADAAQRAKWDAMQVGAWSGRTSQVIATPSAATNYGPELDHSYYVKPGFITSSYQQGVAMMSSRNAPWYDRVIGGVAATAMAPMMLIEETGRAMMNVPYYGRQAGQNAAQFVLADSTEGRVVAALNFVSNASAGILGAGAIVPGTVSMRAPVLTAQEMAVAQFPGAEATAAARATYAASPSDIAGPDLGARPMGVAFDGTVYRLESPSRVGTTFDVHAGNIASDHRYSAPGVGSVYGATSADTALAEVEHYGVAAGRVSVTKNVSFGNVLDLTKPEVRSQLNVTLEQIAGDSYAITHQLGDFARASGYDAILAPSARNPSGSNLVMFPKVTQ